MPASPAELIADLSARGVEFVCCSMVDGGGIDRVKCVPLDKLEQAVRRGIGTPISWSMSLSNDHFAQPDGLGGPTGDLRLRPDLAALVQLAATPFWAWAPVDQYTVDGEVFALCQRSFLKRMVDQAHDAGFEAAMAYEFEWFATRASASAALGEPAHEGPGFSSAAWAATHVLAEDLLGALKRQEMGVELFHPEYAHGQLEVSFAPRDPLAAADLNVLFRHTARSVSERHGCRASFAPVRLPGEVASGCHLHFSLKDLDGRSLLHAAEEPRGLTPDGEAFLAGVLAEAGPLTALGCPTVPSYERLKPQRWACAYRVWGHENREAVLRVIRGMVGERSETANAEFRAIDCGAHPYLMAGALIAAGLDGVRLGLRLPEPVDGDPHRLGDTERQARGIVRLPQSLSEAAGELAASSVLRTALGAELHDAVVAVRRAEAAADEGRPLDDLIAEHFNRF